MSLSVPRTVLIVEDSEIYLDILEVALRKVGVIHVFRARDGHEAKRLMSGRAHSIDLILMDLCLPDLDGIELLDHFDDCQADTRLLLLSGMPRHLLDMATELAEAKGLHLIGGLQKPVSISALMDMVRGQDWNSTRPATAGHSLDGRLSER